MKKLFMVLPGVNQFTWEIFFLNGRNFTRCPNIQDSNSKFEHSSQKITYKFDLNFERNLKKFLKKWKGNMTCEKFCTCYSWKNVKTNFFKILYIFKNIYGRI